ncbi:DUF6600 domain-containing protein [Dyadobacter sp. CY343]|uniref:DUF6600 domain-containing protein n=1 Tax=Dyadobacter sp. CY343 TaxID=2907299 RepID=UPI001F43921A|nr:DUF6600 domain-containing protein [Dyadobacter sp. CY343]MCE7058653.1 hypothetical protein [Dyadobacter sp. CY343]
MNTMRIFRILGLFVILSGGVSVSNETQAQPGVSVSFQTFYNELSPYGRWVRNPQFGSVWVPDVSREFQPYSTNGYWEVTEYGNTWVSDYDWGWAPFHYGRWSFDDFNGWFWIPDYEWGPAWVNWRSGGGYYGWAPLGPGMNVNVSINIPSFWWVFVPQQYVSYRNWHSYCPPRRRVTHVYNQTVIINNYYRSNNRTYVYGPRRDEIERVTRRSVPVRTIDATPSGRGRVIVAGNNNDDRGARSRSDRTGSVIDADRAGRGSRGNNDYNNRNERIGGDVDRSDRTGNSNRNERINGSNERNNGGFERGDRNGRINENSNERGENSRIESTPRIPSEDRENMRSNRNRGGLEPSAPVENRYESPRQSERGNRQPSSPEYSAPRSERSNRSNNAPANPGPSRGSYEAPQRETRQERSAPEPRSNGRSSQESPSRGASERSSRSPR